MLTKALFAASVAVVSLGLGEAAQAVTLTKSVDFAGFGPSVSELLYDLGNGLELTVTAGTHAGGSGANAPLTGINPALITQTGGGSPGLGVRSSPGDTSSQLDAFGPDEFLRFTFNQEVNLLSTIFEAAGSGDEFDAGVDGVDLLITSTLGTDNLRSFPGAGFPGSTDRLVDFSALPTMGSVFDFYTTDTFDDYRIRTIEISQTVPEPASLLGLLAIGAVATGKVLKRKAQNC